MCDPLTYMWVRDSLLHMLRTLLKEVVQQQIIEVK